MDPAARGSYRCAMRVLRGARAAYGLMVLAALSACTARPGGPSGTPGVADPNENPGVPAADPQAPTRGVNDERWRDAPYVVLLSLDGFASRYLERHRPPYLSGLARSGVWASEGLIASYPTKTFPNHYTLATGLHPARHGIVANQFRDPARSGSYRRSDRTTIEDGSWYGGEPIWVTAERQGMVAASFFWVGSEADVQGVRPSHWRRYDGSVRDETRVDQVLTWLALPAANRPHLITMYLSTVDDAGHRFGPDSPQLADAVLEVDRLVGRLRNGLVALPHGHRVHLVVVSDHGMDAFTPEGVRYLEDVTDVDDLDMPESGPNANLWVDGPPGRVLEVRALVDAGLPGVRAYLPDEVPERLAYRGHPRLGDLVLVTDSSVVVALARDPERPPAGGFTHGWDPDLRSMRALFLASGPRLAPGVEVSPVRAVDVYPLLAELLGLEPAADLDGSITTWRGALRPR